MNLTTVIDSIVHDHSKIHVRLADWETALSQFNTNDFFQSQRGLQRLWGLVAFFEEAVPQHFQQEEASLFSALEAKFPNTLPTLSHFMDEHVRFLEQWKEYKRELLVCDVVAGEPRRVCESGARLIAQLRRHLQDEEVELLPLVEAA